LALRALSDAAYSRGARLARASLQPTEINLATLLEKIGAPPKRKAVIDDCALLIDEEVKKKGGFSGAAIKLAFAAVKAVKPGFIPEAVDHLLDDFATRMEPFYQGHVQGIGKGDARSLPSHFLEQAGPIAEALLGITDARAQRAQNAVVKKSYEKLRPSAKKHVEEAVPGIARLVEKHTA
jgi:hypothetical protein